MAYYGHASNTSNLGSNMHLSFVFAALVEIPAFSIPFIINFFGRRWTLFVCFLTSGAMSIFYVSTPSGKSAHDILSFRNSCPWQHWIPYVPSNAFYESMLAQKCPLFKSHLIGHTILCDSDC